MCMMVYISNYDESTKGIKRTCKIEVFKEGNQAVNWKKSSALAAHRIKMNNQNVAVILIIATLAYMGSLRYTMRKDSELSSHS